MHLFHVFVDVKSKLNFTPGDLKEQKVAEFTVAVFQRRNSVTNTKKLRNLVLPSEQSLYLGKYYFNVYEFLERWVHSSIRIKLSDKCFRWFPATRCWCPSAGYHDMATPYKGLQIWVNHFFEYLAHEKLHRSESWRGSLHIYLLLFPRFGTLSIKPFWFLLHPF